MEEEGISVLLSTSTYKNFVNAEEKQNVQG